MSSTQLDSNNKIMHFTLHTLLSFILVQCKTRINMCPASCNVITAHNEIIRQVISNGNYIGHNSRFKECRKVLTLRQTAVSLAGQRPGINSALPVPKEVRDAMFQGGHIGRDGPRELIRNVHWIFTTQFGSRCRQVSFCRDLLIIIYYAISSFKLI